MRYLEGLKARDSYAQQPRFLPLLGSGALFCEPENAIRKQDNKKNFEHCKQQQIVPQKESKKEMQANDDV